MFGAVLHITKQFHIGLPHHSACTTLPPPLLLRRGGRSTKVPAKPRGSQRPASRSGGDDTTHHRGEVSGVKYV